MHAELQAGTYVYTPEALARNTETGPFHTRTRPYRVEKLMQAWGALRPRRERKIGRLQQPSWRNLGT